MNRALPWLLPIVAFLAALLVTATVRDETAPGPAPPVRAAKLRAPASEPPPAPPRVVLAGVRDLPAPLATPEPTPPAPLPEPVPFSPAPAPTPTAAPTPGPAPPAPAPPPPAPPPPAPTPRLTPAPTFDDSGSGPVIDDDGVSP